MEKTFGEIGTACTLAYGIQSQGVQNRLHLVPLLGILYSFVEPWGFLHPLGLFSHQKKIPDLAPSIHENWDTSPLLLFAV
jgi:hypothetical protein